MTEYCGAWLACVCVFVVLAVNVCFFFHNTQHVVYELVSGGCLQWLPYTLYAAKKINTNKGGHPGMYAGNHETYGCFDMFSYGGRS